MVYPNFGDSSKTSLIQGVVLAQVATTLFLYILLKIIHYLKWGYKQDISPKQDEGKEEQAVDERKWDQKGWNIYFPIIFGNHLIAIGIPIVYYPQVATAVISFLHMGLFVGVLIVNIFIKDLQPGKGSRTTVTRILWGIMCFFNIVLILMGLAGCGSLLY